MNNLRRARSIRAIFALLVFGIVLQSHQCYAQQSAAMATFGSIYLTPNGRYIGLSAPGSQALVQPASARPVIVRDYDGTDRWKVANVGLNQVDQNAQSGFAVSDDGSRVAFAMVEPSRNPEGSFGIFVRNIMTEETVQITSGRLGLEEEVTLCGFSGSDGAAVLYRQVTNGNPFVKLARLNLARTAVETTMMINATTCSSTRQLSSNGRWIVFETTLSIDPTDPGAMDVYLYDTLSESYTWLSQNVGARGSCSAPFFSADRTRVLFTCDQNAAVLWAVTLSNVAAGASPLYVPLDSIPPYDAVGSFVYYSGYNQIYINDTTTGTVVEVISTYINPPSGFSYSPIWRVSSTGSRMLVAYGSTLNPTLFPGVQKNIWDVSGDIRHLYMLSVDAGNVTVDVIRQPECPFRSTELCFDLSPLANQLTFTARYQDIESFGFSADGNRVFFSLDRDDLPPVPFSDQNSGNVLGYIRDMTTGTFQKVTVRPGVVFTDSVYPNMVMNNDGSRALFVGFGTPFENENCYRSLHGFNYATQTAFPVAAFNGTCPRLSDFDHVFSGNDGRYVYFATSDRIFGYHPSGTVQIYRFDVQTNETILASTDSAGTPLPADSNNPKTSANFRYLTFSYNSGIGIKDTQTGVFDSSVFVTSTGGTPAYGAVQRAISDDGRYIGFSTRASLIPGVPDAVSLNTYLYVKDRQSSSLLIATDPDTNTPIQLEDTPISCSADGRYWFGIETRTDPMRGDVDTGGIVIFDRLLNSTTVLLRNLLKGRRTEPGGITPSGEWMFFATPMGVDPRDANGRFDIYRCRRDGTGCQIVTANPAGFSYVAPAAPPTSLPAPVAAPTATSSPTSSSAPTALAPAVTNPSPVSPPRAIALTPQGGTPTSHASQILPSIFGASLVGTFLLVLV